MHLHVNETSTYDETLSASVRAQDPLARQAIEIAQLRAKISNYEVRSLYHRLVFGDVPKCQRESEHSSRDECRAAKAEMMAAIHDMKSLHEVIIYSRSLFASARLTVRPAAYDGSRIANNEEPARCVAGRQSLAVTLHTS